MLFAIGTSTVVKGQCDEQLQEISATSHRLLLIVLQVVDWFGALLMFVIGEPLFNGLSNRIVMRLVLGGLVFDSCCNIPVFCFIARPTGNAAKNQVAMHFVTLYFIQLWLREPPNDASNCVYIVTSRLPLACRPRGGSIDAMVAGRSLFSRRAFASCATSACVVGIDRAGSSSVGLAPVIVSNVSVIR